VREASPLALIAEAHGLFPSKGRPTVSDASPRASAFPRSASVLEAVMHTSCSLTINENASPDVPLDMEDSLNRIVPEVSKQPGPFPERGPVPRTRV